MAGRWTKRTLFQKVQSIRTFLDLNTFPIDAHEFVVLNCLNPVIEEIPFPNSKICGILHCGNKTTTIGVNAYHDKEQQHFYCIHEVFHYIWHKNEERSPICGETPRKQDAILEWQANEGAAELMMPHYLFIPELVRGCEMYRIKGLSAIADTKKALQEKYGVTERILYHRIEDLRYEIDQYRKGIPLDKIEILSGNQQKAQQIVVDETYNSIEHRLSAIEDFTKLSVCEACEHHTPYFIADQCDNCPLGKASSPTEDQGGNYGIQHQINMG